MKTTINIDEELLKDAAEYTGLTQKTAIVHLALEELVRRLAAKQLAEMGGSDPTATLGPRRRKGQSR
ncbi:MAG: type II toxin-antitoxin system VapB family antitoxin [Candidatus Eisenbacteria bacterium]|nr:type II toxin-antitoxin system VapB family antitoxin [Candidatus Eisenbacteria bacterium]